LSKIKHFFLVQNHLNNFFVSMFLKNKQNNLFFHIYFSVSSISITTLVTKKIISITPLQYSILSFLFKPSVELYHSSIKFRNRTLQFQRDSVLKSQAPIEINLTQTFLFINPPTHRSITGWKRVRFQLEPLSESLGFTPRYYLFPFWLLLCFRSICYIFCYTRFSLHFIRWLHLLIDLYKFFFTLYVFPWSWSLYCANMSLWKN